MISPTVLRRLAAITSISTFLQISLGTTVRVSGSGLGCPDWPLCHGRVYPLWNIHTIIEISHRYLGTITGTLVILTVAAAWIVYRRERRHVAWLATATLLAIAGEGVLGGAVVIRELAPWLVTAHLALALTILGLLIVTAVIAKPPAPVTVDRGFARRAVLAAGLVFAVAVAGSAVVASHADAVCKSWPLCGGGFQPDFAGVDWFNMAHRLLAAATGLLVLHVCAQAWRRHRHVPGLETAAIATAGLLLLQGFVLGPGVAITDENAVWNGLHVAVATGVWAGALTVAVLAVRHAAGRMASTPALRLEEARGT